MLPLAVSTPRREHAAAQIRVWDARRADVAPANRRPRPVFRRKIAGALDRRRSRRTFKAIMLLLAIQLYTYVVLASVILSWVRLEPTNPVVKVVNALTEPVLKPIRAVLPSFMGLDFSPLVLLLALSILRRFL